MAKASSVSSNRPQVFINFRGKDLRKSFICFLVTALKNENINVFIDEHEERGKKLSDLFIRIGDSEIVLVIFSEGYTESKWCLDELVKITECMDQEKLRVIPIFYKLDIAVVKRFQGKFGDQFRDLECRYNNTKPETPQKWKEAVVSVCQRFALSLSENSDITDEDFIRIIVTEVKKMLSDSSTRIDGKIVKNDEASNEEAVEVYQSNNMTGNTQIQLPEPSYELKVWVLEARELSITWSNDSEYWFWLPLINRSPNESVKEVAILKKVCWLHISGKFDTQYLSPRTRYEVVFVVALLRSNSKWKTPVNLKLVLPKSLGKLQERSVNMLDYLSEDWVDIPVGEFTTSNKNIGEIYFAMYDHDCNQWKSRLFIKGVAIRPKS
ncbi:PREDICTED: protein PHLOEM PROTEIN 2-LIKE A5 [Camelina sativa]|uniref:Protein PHLOEM PROTEIN 2-LIKE A5 n=1 Tax=Camelina sativa TaxID=90675 RepID=A0ABM0UDW6_CAMSA|nr:PREDICTED: protein PHLOEM PROTEIN 2-LIKE A5 [Camelina sativa]